MRYQFIDLNIVIAHQLLLSLMLGSLSMLLYKQYEVSLYGICKTPGTDINYR